MQTIDCELDYWVGAIKINASLPPDEGLKVLLTAFPLVKAFLHVKASCSLSSQNLLGPRSRPRSNGDCICKPDYWVGPPRSMPVCLPMRVSRC